MWSLQDTMMEILVTAAVSFALTAVLGKLLIPLLRRLKAGQSIKEIGPAWHMSKQGTPTMGGFMFILAIGALVAARLAPVRVWAASTSTASPLSSAPSASSTTI